MGFFDFVVNAGKKILGGDDEPAPAAPSGPSAEEVKRLADRRRAASLVKVVEGLELEVSDLSIRVDGQTATVSGTAANQSEREKVVLAIGNVAGIARVDDQMSVAESEPESVFYTVVRGDTLGKIAQQHYGKASKYPVIFEANRPMLTDPDKIYPGQVLRIPPLEG